MFEINKVVWKDGMFMYPQHFQQQDNYYEKTLQDHFMLQPFYNWGISKLELDEGYLKLNKIVIKSCIGVFPDGTYFSIPDRDDIPEPIEIPPEYNSKLIYLGISIDNRCSVRQPQAYTKRSDYSRYYPEEREVRDNNSESGEKSITIAKLNINLFLEDEYKGSMIFFPILKILDSSNGVKLDPSYIPPCLRVKSSRVLQSYANQILGLLSQYANMNTHLIGEGINMQNVGRIENALILQSVNCYKYLFQLILNDMTLTPYFLLQKVVELIGSLVIFVRDSDLEQVEIKYDHLKLSESFKTLINFTNVLFEKLHSYISTQIDFNLETSNTYTAKLPDLSLKSFNLVLGIEFAEIQPQEHEQAFHHIKISSIEDLEHIISLQISGIKFSLLNVLPSFVSYNEKTLYLKLKQEGEFWERIEKNKSLAIYLSTKLNKVKAVKLWMIPNKQSGS